MVDRLPSSSLIDKSLSQKTGPDPVLGVGLVLLGVLIMGIAGAATLHYVFNVGTAIAIVGSVVFLVSVALSSLRTRQEAKKQAEAASAPPSELGQGQGSEG